MKKILFSFVLLIIATFIGMTNILATTITLETLVNKINSSNYGAYFTNELYGFEEDMIITIDSQVIDNSVKVIATIASEANPSEKMEAEAIYTLDGNILSTTMNLLDGIDPEDIEKFLENMIYLLLKNAALMSVVDAVGQLSGYSQGEVIEILNILEEDVALSLSLEENGLEMSQPDENSINIKINLDKQMNLTVNTTTETTSTSTTSTTTSSATSATTTTSQIKNTSALDIKNPNTGQTSINILLVTVVLTILGGLCYSAHKDNKFKKI